MCSLPYVSEYCVLQEVEGKKEDTLGGTRTREGGKDEEERWWEALIMLELYTLALV